MDSRFFISVYLCSSVDSLFPWGGLAARAVVAAAAGDDDAANLGFAAEAGLACALVDAVAKLEFPAIAAGIHVVGNR